MADSHRCIYARGWMNWPWATSKSAWALVCYQQKKARDLGFLNSTNIRKPNWLLFLTNQTIPNICYRFQSYVGISTQAPRRNMQYIFSKWEIPSLAGNIRREIKGTEEPTSTNQTQIKNFISCTRLKYQKSCKNGQEVMQAGRACCWSFSWRTRSRKKISCWWRRSEPWKRPGLTMISSRLLKGEESKTHLYTLLHWRIECPDMGHVDPLL